MKEQNLKVQTTYFKASSRWFSANALAITPLDMSSRPIPVAFFFLAHCKDAHEQFQQTTAGNSFVSCVFLIDTTLHLYATISYVCMYAG